MLLCIYDVLISYCETYIKYVITDYRNKSCVFQTVKLLLSFLRQQILVKILKMIQSSEIFYITLSESI